MGVDYRAARDEDLPTCLELFEESVSDMRLRHNIALAPHHDGARRLAMYRHHLATGIFQVAEADGRIIAFASAVVRDHLWFLSGLWARPAVQGQHVGMTLLRGVWEAGRDLGATTFFVWSSVDLPAMAAYMKIGMLPGTQILMLEGAPQPQAVPSGYTATPLSTAFAITLDEAVLGVRRGMDHELLTRLGDEGRQVMHDGRPVGYCYIHEGILGPGAWTDDRHAAALLSLACREASPDGGRVALMIPGMNHVALRYAFGTGLRLTGFAHLLMSARFGKLERYLPSGPALF